MNVRKVIFGVANSLDNYIARKDDGVDWLMWSKEVNQLMTDFWKRIDTILMGRKTYDVGRRLSKGKSAAYPGVKTYIFSRTLKAGQDEGVEIVGDDAVQFVRDLKAREGKDICLMGGGELAKTFFEADLIDEVGLNIHPVLLGEGIPLFYEMSRQINLELLECKPLKTGCVYVYYRVKR